MRKQELIHLHTLLVEVENYSGLKTDLSDYESLGIGPSSIYCSKDEHREAVFALIESMTDDLRPVNTTMARADPLRPE